MSSLLLSSNKVQISATESSANTQSPLQVVNKRPADMSKGRLERFNKHLANIASLKPELLASLSFLLDEEILELRKQSGILGLHSWRLEIACDAQIWERTAGKGGRGLIEKNGISATLMKRAKQIGCSMRTIRRNAAIFKTFSPETIDTSVTTLPEKGFYTAAVSAPKPLEALDRFLELKRANPKFSPADAKRLISAERKVDEKANATFLLKNRGAENITLEEHLRWAITEVERLKTACPDKMVAQRLYGSFIQDLREQLDTMFMEDVTAALTKAWNAGCHREDQLAERTGLSRQIVHQAMCALKEEGLFCQVEQRGETEMAKGGHVMLWHKISEPLGTGFRVISSAGRFNQDYDGNLD